MLKTAVNAGVPVLVFVAMVVVGMELTMSDFRRVARQPRIIVAATIGQIVLLPVAKSSSQCSRQHIFLRNCQSFSQPLWCSEACGSKGKENLSELSKHESLRASIGQSGFGNCFKPCGRCRHFSVSFGSRTSAAPEYHRGVMQQAGGGQLPVGPSSPGPFAF